jgi:hypothetical protein
VTRSIKPEPRLLLGSLGVVALLIWVLTGNGLPPMIVPPGRSVSPYPSLVTAFLALTVLVSLAPVLRKGSIKERLASVLIGAFPCLALGLVVLWAIQLLQTGRS